MIFVGVLKKSHRLGIGTQFRQELLIQRKQTTYEKIRIHGYEKEKKIRLK